MQYMLRLDGSRGMGSYYIYKVPESRIADLNAAGGYPIEAKVWSIVYRRVSNSFLDPMYVEFEKKHVTQNVRAAEAGAAQGVSLSWTRWGGATAAFDSQTYFV